MTLYELKKVVGKRIVSSLGHAVSLEMAVEDAQFMIEAGDATEVWITDPTNPDNVMAVVDQQGVTYG